MPSVAQVLSSEFARSWHEAVAIVQEAASQMHPGMALPGPGDLEIDEAGTLTFGFGDETSENPVTALGGLLRSLLAGVEAPQALQDLATENAGPGPAHASVASFSQALAFFERPNRANDIRAIAGRLSRFREKSSSEQEFEKLREKVANAPDQKKEEQERRKQPKLSQRQQMMVVGAVCLVLFGTLGFRSGLHRNIGSLTSRAESGIQNAVSAGLERFGVSKAASAAPAPEPVEAERTSSVANRPATARDSSRTASNPNRSSRPARDSRPMTFTPAAARPEVKEDPAATGVTGVLPSTGTTGVSPLAPLPPPRPDATPTLAVSAGGGAVFSAANPEVQAPVLVRPQLPKEPAPGDDTGIFDMLIDENGDVAHVKLISPRRRFHDRMLVAAAKAWKFKPAMLNGHPVKYRIRIPIILTWMP